MTIKIIACEVMKKELLSIMKVPDVEYEFVSMNLHLYPEKLRKELQCIIERSTGYSRIILAYYLLKPVAAAKRLIFRNHEK